MESIYIELALYGRKNECARTDAVFLPISEVCNDTVSLKTLQDHKRMPLDQVIKLFFIEKIKF